MSDSDHDHPPASTARYEEHRQGEEQGEGGGGAEGAVDLLAAKKSWLAE